MENKPYYYIDHEEIHLLGGSLSFENIDITRGIDMVTFPVLHDEMINWNFWIDGKEVKKEVPLFGLEHYKRVGETNIFLYRDVSEINRMISDD